MRKCIFSLSRRLVLPAGAAMLATSLVWAAPLEKQQPDAAKTEDVAVQSDLPADAVDLTDKVEVTVIGNLRSSSKSAHSVSLTIKNISKEDLQGPLAIVVDGTGIEGLKLTQDDGKLSDDRPYSIIVAAKDDLKAGRILRSQKLNFKTEQMLKPADRAQFDLKVRVCRVNRTEVAADENQLVEGKSYTQKEFDRVMAIQEKWTLPLIKKGNGLVYGTATAENDKGELVVRVYTQRSGLDDILPETVEGIPVQIKTTGEPFSREHPKSTLIYENGRPKVGQGGKVQGPEPTEAYTDESGVYHPSFSGPGGDPTIRFARPVPIGVSIANADRLFDADPFTPACYSGTLGCRCVDSLGVRYILTNAHVGGGLTIPPDGDPIPIGFITGFIGDTIVQPGTGDGGMCGFDLEDPVQLQFLLDWINTNAIGTLVDIESTITTTRAFIPCNDDEELPICAPINYMDASVVRLTGNTASFDTPIGGYDVIINPQPYSKVRIGVPVQKYGRTTIYSQGQVTGVNVAVAVGSDEEGAGYYIKQIEVINTTGFANFGGPGDSGSLIITNLPGESEDRSPVALLFAGGGNVTLANPIAPILTRFGLMVDDGTNPQFTTGISGTSGTVIGPLKPPSPLR